MEDNKSYSLNLQIVQSNLLAHISYSSFQKQLLPAMKASEK